MSRATVTPVTTDKLHWLHHAPPYHPQSRTPRYVYVVVGIVGLMAGWVVLGWLF
jgi:hypothetical protein